jgi:DNA-binding XRE family transcriptional regulator
MPGPKSPAHAAIGEALREFRTQRSISQEELGYQAGLHRNYVGACDAARSTCR